MSSCINQYNNGYRIYVDIMTGGNCRNVDIIYWSVRSFSRLREKGAKDEDGESLF